MGLLPFFRENTIEAGCDEAGRGCLAGPVVAAAVILPADFSHPMLDDSKKLSAKQRLTLRPQIMEEALAWGVGVVSHQEIDEINILNASFLAMHRAVEQLKTIPEALLIDGNRFNAYPNIAHHCIIKGDGKYLSIAAASVLAKTHRDDLMKKLDLDKGSEVLDLACGKGRHSLYLSKLGYNVTGVDLAANSIEIANKDSNENLHFEVRDMRKAFTENKFDLVANLFTSFGYFDNLDDNIQVLNSIETMMNEQGHFVIDFMNVDKVIRNLVAEEEKEIDGILFKITREVKNGNILKNITVIDQDITLQFQEKVQALTIDNFKELISKTDLVVDAFYGAYNLSVFDADVSDRLIIVGTKW